MKPKVSRGKEIIKIRVETKRDGRRKERGLKGKERRKRKSTKLKTSFER